MLRIDEKKKGKKGPSSRAQPDIKIVSDEGRDRSRARVLVADIAADELSSLNYFGFSPRSLRNK